MLGDRHQLDVGESHLAHVLRKRERNVAIGRQLFRIRAAPRAKMNFVGRHRRIERVACAARLHPVAVLPLVLERPDARCRQRRCFRAERERIRLVHGVAAVRRDHMEFVRVAASHVRDRALPDARVVRARRQRVGRGVPVVECANDRDARCIRRPDAKACLAFRTFAFCTLAFNPSASEELVESAMGSLSEKVDVLIVTHGLTPLDRVRGISPIAQSNGSVKI